MKIAVYTIAKNEEQYVEKWFDSAIEADYLLIADTGSTDETIPLAHDYGIHVIHAKVIPWRFDDARNAALAALPADIDVCIALDMDEVLTPGWRAKVEVMFKGNPTLDRLRYNYVWSWNEDGTPGLTYYGDKIHVRSGFRWVGPVHETLDKCKLWSPEVQDYIEDTLIEHYPDNSKSRSSYLELLKLATLENPYNDRNAHYYARDLMFAGRHLEAIEEFNRHLALHTAVWKDERAASLRYIGDCYWALGDQSRAMLYFVRSINEQPELREGYVAVAQGQRARGNYQAVIQACEDALKIKARSKTYLSQAYCWNGWIEQMLAEAKEHI